MRIVTRVNWRRWIVGIYVDSLTVAVFIGPLAIDFLYRWDEIADWWVAGEEPSS